MAIWPALLLCSGQAACRTARDAARGSTLWLANWDSGGACSQLSKELKAAGYTISLNSLEGYVPATLAAETMLLSSSSPPTEKARRPIPCALLPATLCGTLPAAWRPLVRHTRTWRFSLRTLLSVRKESRRKAQRPGCNVYLPRTDSDVDVDAPFTAWKQAFAKRFSELHLNRHPPSRGPPRVERRSSDQQAPAPHAAQRHSRGNLISHP